MITPNWIKRIKNPSLKNNFTRIYAPLFYGNEKKYLNNCIDTGWISPKGKYVKLFEKAFANYCHVPYAVSASSGTSALHLSLAALGVKRGDEVILPSFTMASTAFAISYLGAKPIFVDSYIYDGTIDINQISDKITSKTRVILPVDVYGNICDYTTINKIAKQRNVYVLEDAADAFGCIFHGKRIGTVSEISAFSLYSNKVLTTGQGGMITTHSKKLYLRLKRLNNYYFSPMRHFWHEEIGYNHRLSNLQAAVGLAQIENVESILTKKRMIAKWYAEFLQEIQNKLISFNYNSSSCKSNYWMVAYRVKEEKLDVGKLRHFLAGKNFETRSFFIPLHLQPAFRKKEYRGQFPNSEILAKTGVLLPCGPGLTKNEIEKISSFIIQYFKH